jgi:hypothetical protein
MGYGSWLLSLVLPYEMAPVPDEFRGMALDILEIENSSWIAFLKQ